MEKISIFPILDAGMTWRRPWKTERRRQYLRRKSDGKSHGKLGSNLGHFFRTSLKFYMLCASWEDLIASVASGIFQKVMCLITEGCSQNGYCPVGLLELPRENSTHQREKTVLFYQNLTHIPSLAILQAKMAEAPSNAV